MRHCKSYQSRHHLQGHFVRESLLYEHPELHLALSFLAKTTKNQPFKVIQFNWTDRRTDRSYDPFDDLLF